MEPAKAVGDTEGTADDVALGAVVAVEVADGIAVAVAVAVGEAACCPPRSPRITATSAIATIAAAPPNATTPRHRFGRCGTLTDATRRLFASFMKSSSRRSSIAMAVLQLAPQPAQSRVES